jgi:hypothetical protein
MRDDGKELVRPTAMRRLAITDLTRQAQGPQGRDPAAVLPRAQTLPARGRFDEPRREVQNLPPAYVVRRPSSRTVPRRVPAPISNLHDLGRPVLKFFFRAFAQRGRSTRGRRTRPWARSRSSSSAKVRCVCADFEKP